MAESYLDQGLVEEIVVDAHMAGMGLESAIPTAGA
jgi:hypothetical protein